MRLPGGFSSSTPSNFITNNNFVNTSPFLRKLLGTRNGLFFLFGAAVVFIYLIMYTGFISLFWMSQEEWEREQKRLADLRDGGYRTCKRRKSFTNDNEEHDADDHQHHDEVELRYSPKIRYEPSPFHPRQNFDHQDDSPLKRVCDETATSSKLPKDWDGGYGWVFVKYIPSDFESEWYEAAKPLDGKSGTPLCDLLRGKFKSQHEAYLAQGHRFAPDNTAHLKSCDLTEKYSAAVESGNDFTYQDLYSSDPLHFDSAIFSRYEYVYKCTRPPCRSKPPANGPKIGTVKYSYIEPLVGLLRYPTACYDDRYEGSIINKSYMIIDPWALVNPSRSTISPDPKIYYFDAGASTWEKGSGGASQSWFYQVYDAVCVRFQNFFMWEMQKHDAVKVFDRIPGHLRPGYHWYNIPLSVDMYSWDNPLNHLLVEARKEDVVVMKIDFDAPSLEHALLDAILRHRELSDLIDELYFEHHVNQEVMKVYWQTQESKVYHSDSIKLFTSLRERGIRTHSWV